MMSAARMMNAGRQESRRGPEPPGTAPVGPPGRRAALRCRACLYLVLHLIERIVGPLGLRVDESSPWADARLPDGSRVQTNFLDAPFSRRPYAAGDSPSVNPAGVSALARENVGDRLVSGQSESSGRLPGVKAPTGSTVRLLR